MDPNLKCDQKFKPCYNRNTSTPGRKRHASVCANACLHYSGLACLSLSLINDPAVFLYIHLLSLTVSLPRTTHYSVQTICRRLLTLEAGK